MSNKNSSALVGSYDTVDQASADAEAVVDAHRRGNVGHVEIAVVSRDEIGKLTWNQHERLGGIHLSHAPTEELVRLSDHLGANSVTLLVIGSSDDSAVIEQTATRARERTTQVIEHLSMAEGFFSDSYGAPPEEDTGFEDGSVGHLGV